MTNVSKVYVDCRSNPVTSSGKMRCNSNCKFHVTASLCRFQLVKYVIQQSSRSNGANEEMLTVCRAYYYCNPRVLENIKEFENNYDQDSCIKWYTRNTFIYQLINKALRTEDIEQLYTFRYYIADLSQQLVKECRKTVATKSVDLRLYRGTAISKKEADTLQTNVGQLIATNSYWSTSRDRETALKLCESTKK